MLDIITAFLVIAGLVNPFSLISMYEVRQFDGFGVVSRFNDNLIEIKPSDNIKTVSVKMSANFTNLEPGCEISLKPKIPGVFSPEFEIERASPGIPITKKGEEFVLRSSGPELTLKLTAKAFLNPGEPAKSNISGLLGPEDDFFTYDTENPGMKRTAKALNSSDPEKTLENIFRYTKETIKNGECDEYTKLFITLSRILGIPARARINSDHVWAEVCLPARGQCRWVIVDPTWGNRYDEFFENDSLHKYSISLDFEPGCKATVEEREQWRLE